MENTEKLETVKRVMIVCDKIQEINRLRRIFDKSFIIKAASSVQSGAFFEENSDSGIFIYHIGSDFKHLFTFYKEMRANKKTERLPLIVIADLSVLKILTDTIEMTDTSIVGTAISQENLLALINSLIEI